LAALAAGVGGVLALPVKVAVIDPVVHVLVRRFHRWPDRVGR
jgi:hypothetical protein